MRKFVFSIMAAFGFILSGAQPHLTVLPSTPGFADTLVAGSSITYLAIVRNNGNMVFSDSFNINIGVRDTAFLPPQVAYVHSVPVTQILVGQNDTQQVTHTIDTTYFKEGNNTVVIWPVSGSSPTVDTLEFDVYVVYFNGIEDPGDMVSIKILPNPVTDFLRIVSENGIEQVRIFGLSGQLVQSVSRSSWIDVSALTPAIYIVEIQDKSGRIKRVKILKG